VVSPILTLYTTPVFDMLIDGCADASGRRR